jgi:hypothetical protein
LANTVNLRVDFVDKIQLRGGKEWTMSVSTGLSNF